jgi:predicted metal-dependent enzyme (double-stranded beta helix superfamily)
MKKSVTLMGIHTNLVMNPMATVLTVVQAPAMSKGTETSYLIAVKQEELPDAFEEAGGEVEMVIEEVGIVSARSAATYCDLHRDNIIDTGFAFDHPDGKDNADQPGNQTLVSDTLIASGENNWNNSGSLHDMQEYWMANDGLDIRGPSG